MAEVLLLPLTKSVIIKLTNSFTFEPLITHTNEAINTAISVQDDLKVIQNNLHSVSSVLADAEKKQITNNPIKIWLRDFKSIIFDIDDLLDEAATDSLQHRLKTGDFRHNLRYSFCSFHLCSDIQEIRLKLEFLVPKIDEFGLIEAQDEHLFDNISDHFDEIRDYFDKYDSIVIGRDEAKDEIISKVLSVSNVDSLSVLPIIGISGIGKTTLAKLVHCDVGCFDLKLWACISEKFDVQSILTNIIVQNNEVNFEVYGKSFEEMFEKIEELMRGKKYFLVLDDMWLEDELEWKKVEKCLGIGKEGSMILITTRNEKVALISKTMEPYVLDGLSKHECWTMFKKLAFEGVAEEARSNFQKIGRTIASNCYGIPLVVKVFSSMLRFEKEDYEWKKLKDSTLNGDEYDVDKVMQLLKICYYKLRPNLKQIFAYMSLFPKDYVYDSSKMVDMGIALGLFQQENGNKQSKDVAYSYLMELSLNSLLSIQEHQKCNSSNARFKLHDLTHDLAMNSMGDELASVTINQKMPTISNCTKHIIWRGQCSMDSLLPPTQLHVELGEATKARTLRISDVKIISRSIIEEIISKFVYLRVLDLSGCVIEELPNSVGKLKLLRYLDLTGNFIIQALPNTICKLVNLDTFHTKGCVRLKELPKDWYMLLRLRKFSLTTLQETLIGTKMNELSSLQQMEIYSCPRLVSLWGTSDNVQGLTSLQSLYIHECPKMTQLPDCMRFLANLERLTLQDCEALDLELGQEALQGLENLKELYITLLPKITRLPRAILSARATLEILELDDCKGLVKLVDPIEDWFGEFESLHRILIKRCPNLKYLPNSICRLGSLEDIVIMKSPLLAKSCSLTPESKALDFTLIHHVSKIQIDDAILFKRQTDSIEDDRNPLRTSIMSFWSNAVDMTSKKPHFD